MIAQEIVDILYEALDFSPEEMQGFADAASYNFSWDYSPNKYAPDPPDGTYRLEFDMSMFRATGSIYIGMSGTPYDNARGRKHVNFSANIHWPSPHGGSWSANSRLRRFEAKFTNLEDFKAKFEEWVRGPLTVAFKKGMSQARFHACVRKLDHALIWTRNTEGLASKEEIAALQKRFDYHEEKGPDSYSAMGMFEDPRTEGKETDYEYLTSDDVRFWNMLADEYDARRPQPR